MGHTLCRPLLFGICSVVVLGGCAMSKQRSEPAGGTSPWTPGTYDLVAAVDYRLDSESGPRTKRLENRAQLTVGREHTLSLTTTSGLCQTPTPEQLRQDRARGHRTFRCQDAHFVLKPMAGTVGGTVDISVQEGIRTRGTCKEWREAAGGQRICVEYNWHVAYRTRNKRASLRVTGSSVRLRPDADGNGEGRADVPSLRPGSESARSRG